MPQPTHIHVYTATQPAAGQEVELLSSDVPKHKCQPNEVQKNQLELYCHAKIPIHVQTQTSRPNVLRYGKQKEVGISGTAVPLNHNLQTTHASKINRPKHIELAEELKQIWRLRRVCILNITSEYHFASVESLIYCIIKQCKVVPVLN
jgi:hypothetical protein